MEVDPSPKSQVHVVVPSDRLVSVAVRPDVENVKSAEGGAAVG